MTATSCDTATGARANPDAVRLLGFYRAANATTPERALTDAEVAKLAGIHTREVIDLVKSLAVDLDVGVLACEAGRYIETDPARVRAYGERCHKRAANIHDRGWTYIRLADRMEAKRRTETTGQRRLDFG